MSVPKLKPRRADIPRLRVPGVGEDVYKSARWQRMTRQLRRSKPVCQRCHNDIATECHHIVPLSVAPARAFDPDNVIPVCMRCHKSLHHKGLGA